MQIKYLKENEIINLENGKRFTLNNTGKLFLVNTMNLDLKLHIKRLVHYIILMK